MSDTIINIGIYVTYFLVAVAVLTTVLFSIFHMVQNLGKAKGALVGVLILAVIVIISYFLSTNEVYPKFNVGPIASKWVGAGILTTFVLIGLALLSAIYVEVAKLFK
ncbi:MAG: hypothetical protein RBS53_11420 [Bacteroidales bacterium]|jgi:hypothetical protein|nr:hypothetical protein [Bacteroidales bacterium]NLM93462.1 hypothetical protein [Bacteroidales bacterium]